MEEEKKDILDAMSFTKTFVKKLFIKYCYFGIIAYILLEISREFLPNFARIIVLVLIIYGFIQKVHLSAVSEVFTLGKTKASDNNKIQKNLMIIYGILFIVGTIGAIILYFYNLRKIEILTSLGLTGVAFIEDKEVLRNNAMHHLIRSIVVQLVADVAIAFLCIDKFKKESAQGDVH